MTESTIPARMKSDPGDALAHRNVVVHFLSQHAPGRHTRRLEARVWVRTILGEHLGAPPRALEFTRRCGRCGREHGRPELAGKFRRALAFSVSYTSGAAALAVTDEGRVGLDIEAVRPASFLHDALSFGERTRIADRATDRVLITLWVRKEAIAKVSGLGLYLSPRRLTVDSPTSVCSVTSDVGSVLTCGLADFAGPSNTVGAVAVEDAFPNVRLRNRRTVAS